MDFAVRLALLYAGLFGAIGIQLPFLPVWLAAKGLDERTIGAVLALATIARLVTVPLGTRAADRLASFKGAIIVGTLGCALSLTILGTVAAPAAIIVFYVLAAAASGPTLPLADAYALRGLTDRGRAYGPVRLWGSAAFIAGTLVAGVLVVWIEPVNIIWILVATYWGAVAAAIGLRPIAGGAPAGNAGGDKLLVRNPSIVAVIVASSCIQASHALLYGFGTLQWTAAGLGGPAIGTLWALSVLAEIFLFAASARFPPALRPAVLLALGAGGAIVRWTVMAFDPPALVLPALQCLHALSFGATHLAAVQFIARAAPSGSAGTMQGLLATANGGLMAAAIAVSGILHVRYGVAGYGAMALLAGIGGVASLVVLARRREPDR
ncbi:MAG TPA: MFS transporter [Xanthobacteraceae bacterium]|nr:MFS transporter [Xanthobacteraceae bacterium]